MLKTIQTLAIVPLFLLGSYGGLAAEQPTLPPAAPAAKPSSSPADSNPFGIKPEGITSPEMRDALNQLRQAGIVPDRRGSLTFFRWTNASPPKLAYLGLWGEKVDDELFSLIAVLPDLEHVSIYETSITNQGLESLTKLPKLRSIAVAPINRYEKAEFGPPQWSYPFMKQRTDRQRVTGRALTELTQLKTLESLNLLDMKLSSSDLNALAAWPKLSNVALPNVIDHETVKHLQACRKLNALTLGNREISAGELATLSTWPSLRKLTLIHAPLSDESLQALAKLETVVELHLEDCGLTDQDLRHLQVPPKLSYLGLERNEINGSGLSQLVKFKLKSLGLEFNNISNKTLPHLLQLTTLDTLGLSYCREVTDEGIQSETLQGMTHLKELRLRGMKQVTDASLNKLTKFGRLRHINLRETKLSPEGVAKLKAAMPQTDVFK